MEMAFNRRMDKQIVVHPYNRILFSNKNKWTIKPQKDLGELYMYIIERKEPIWRGYKLYDSKYMAL